MQNAVAFAEWQGVKINLVDTPGFHMFTHEARAALLPRRIRHRRRQRPDPASSPSPSAFGDSPKKPTSPHRLVNQMDHPKAGGGGGLERPDRRPHDRWGRNCVPVQLPISDAQGFHGVVDLVTMEASPTRPAAMAAAKSPAKFPPRSPPTPRPATRLSSSWSPKAKTS
jgi:elongation factor G